MGPAADGGGSSSSSGRKAGARSFCDTIAVTAAALSVVVVVSFLSLGLAEAQNPLERPGSQGKRDFIHSFIYLFVYLHLFDHRRVIGVVVLVVPVPRRLVS